MRTFTAYIEWDPGSNLYIGTVPGVTGARTQGGSLDELRGNLAEVLSLCLESQEIELDDMSCFVGVQQIELAV